MKALEEPAMATAIAAVNKIRLENMVDDISFKYLVQVDNVELMLPEGNKELIDRFFRTGTVK